MLYKRALTKPIVSVIMAVYNGGKTLQPTLECLVNQSFKNFELVVVNDESKDHSEKIILDFLKHHPEIAVQYHSQKNKGLGGARNTAMRHAHGAILALLDQDDLWYPAKLQKIVDVFYSRPDVSFVTHHLYRCVAGKIRDELACDFMTPNVFHKLLFRGNYFCGSAMSFRRPMLEALGYFSEENKQFDLSEDYDYWLRAAAKGHQFHVIPEILGEYIMHSANFSKNKLYMYRNEWNIVRAHYESRPVKRWSDPIHLAKRRGKILARQFLARVKT